MPRKATGTLMKTRSGLWQGRITLPDGRRICTPPFPAGTSEQMAREKTLALRERLIVDPRYLRQAAEYRASRDALQAQMIHECAKWIAEWHSDRVARGLTSARDSLSHWKTHLAARLGSKHPKDWTTDDFRNLSAMLDAKVQRQEISPKTAVNIWTTATGMADEARSSKLSALRCRDDDPSDGVRGPETGAQASLQYLYPAEVDRFLSCDEVPLQWRRLVAVAVYTYARAGELRALTWDDVDLAHSVINISKAIDRTTGGIKTTKSKRPRPIPIEPALAPLLRMMRRECGGGGLVLPELPSERDMARGLRRWLKRSGIERRSLFESGPSSNQIRFHDLRATGITWMAARGDEPVRIQQRAGHTSFSTTERYLRILDAVGSFGVPFAPLPESLASNESSAESSALRLDDRKYAKTPDFSRVICGADGTRTRPEASADEFPTDFPGVQEESSASIGGAKCANAGALTNQADVSSDPIEAALAGLLNDAAAAGDWGLVARLAGELEARRGVARAAVISLDVERAKRGSK